MREAMTDKLKEAPEVFKMKRPKDLKLSHEFHLHAAYKGQPLFYLKTDAKTHYWIEGRGKVRRLIKWLQKVEKYQQ